MRILIADDEFLVRSSLRSMLEELNLPFNFVGEATNGEEMVAMAEQFLPDIAFVDIRMPRLNGLEAIKTGKKVSPYTRWYVLTGFPEFDYAQEAIRLGVAGYLLKPVNPEELQKALADFFEENQKQKTIQNKQFENELMMLNDGLTSLEFATPESILLRTHYIGAIFSFDSYLPEKTKAKRQLEFCSAVRNSINHWLDNHNRIALFVLPGGELATVGAWEPTHDDRAELWVRAYFKAIEQEVQRSSDKDLAISLLITKKCTAYPDLHSSLERLLALSPLRVVCGTGKKLDLTLLKQQAEKPGMQQLSSLIITLCHCFQEGNYLNYAKSLQDIEKYLSRVNIADRHILLDTLFNFTNCSIHSHLEPNRDRSRWIVLLQQHGEQLKKRLPRDEILNPDIIDQVTTYVDRNYMHDIGIGQMAEQFNITPNYLSTLFHRKIGINFMSYLKKVRMLKAKELLTDPNIQVQQVAEQVGYFSTRHFARLFFEQFGCLPSEYRDSHKNH
ncbi:MAG: response regulator transcription factor [Omnitrophica WOR_2 bacterium]